MKNNYEFLFLNIQLDRRVNVFHLAVYAALLHLWYKAELRNPVQITRQRVMSLSKISAYATYHKCINKLVDLGYIVYSPSYHPVKGSMIEWPVTP